MSVEICILIFYFVLVIGIGFIFSKTASESTSSYFRGGGKMLWWMVGATIFMTQFSAWTFTGAAGKAFTDGLTILGVFVGNVVGFLFSYLYFAAKYRQTRLDTGSEIVRKRFGPANEQFFTWLTVPLSVVSGGLWLNGLGVFVSLILKININTTIYLVGIIVMIVSLMSGAWGVVASDFVQALVVSVISIMCAIVALIQVGGPVNLIQEYPYGFFLGKDMNFPIIVIGTFFFFFIKQIQTNNTMFSAYRYLVAEDSKAARKGALLALILMTFGTLIWFIPPWASAILYPDAGVYYKDLLGNRAAEGVYLVFAERAMPAGTIGLMIACLFAATMSSMDSALNRDSGIFVKSFYKPIINPKATDKQLLKAGYITSGIIGILIILTAQFYTTLRHLSLFDLSMQVGTIIQAPMLVPLFFGLFIRKTPDWAGWVTVLFGALVSVILSKYLTVGNMAEWFSVVLTKREISDLTVMWNILAHLVLTGGFFCLTTLFYKEPVGERKKETEELFKNLDTPVIAEQEHKGNLIYRKEQNFKLGVITLAVGVGVILLALVKNPPLGRLMFIICGLLVMFVGFMLYRESKKYKGE